MSEYRMPSLGADMESGFLREWRVQPGDRIQKGDIIAEVETQKGIIEIEVFEAGTIGKLLVQVDEQVPVGTPMATILAEGEVPGAPVLPVPAAAAPAAPTGPEPGSGPIETGPLPPPAGHIRASPLARRMAEAQGLDLATLRGTGPGGAITREDVEQALAGRVAPAASLAVPSGPPAPAAVPTTTAGVPTIADGVPTIAAVSPTAKVAVPAVVGVAPAPAPGFSSETVRQAVAAAMSKSNREVPHYYQETSIDMSRALAWLTEANKQRPVKGRLLPAVLLIKAVAKALAQVPDLNAWWENGLQRKPDIHIGYVVSLRGGGIMVPAIHDAGHKTPDELMAALNDLIPRARALRLRSSELADSTITLTNLGEGAVEKVFGVIYPPQVALVGFGGICEQPWSENGMLDVRLVLVATLAADHRATDGSTGSRFLQALKHHLQEPENL